MKSVMKSIALASSVALLEVLMAAPAAAESEPAEAASEPEAAGFALSADIGFASAYVWRGWNVFQDSSQMDQNTMLAPSFTLSLPVEGLSVGYWGAYQLNGEARSALVDAGVGAEQDLILGYERPLGDKLSGAFALTYYFYPLADEDIAGTSVPSYLEPSAGVTYAAGPADVGIAVAYFHGMQGELKGSRHLYLNPSVSRSVAINDTLGVDATLGFGYKHFNDSDVEDNVYDVLLSVAIPYAATGAINVTPSLNAAWTNITNAGFGDEYVVWAGVNVGFPVF